jgi:hypothetical protein
MGNMCPYHSVQDEKKRRYGPSITCLFCPQPRRAFTWGGASLATWQVLRHVWSLATSPPELHCFNPNTTPAIALVPHSLHRHSHNKTATMAEVPQNPLISTARASDSSPTVQLHPLVLLTISDCITRHTLRQQTGPVVGAIIGQQNGQEVTMEVAFQAKLKANDAGDVVLDEEWFNKRIEDCE